MVKKLELDKIYSEVIFEQISGNLDYIGEKKSIRDLIKIKTDLSIIYDDLERLAFIIRESDDYGYLYDFDLDRYIGFLLDTLYSISICHIKNEVDILDRFKKIIDTERYDGSSYVIRPEVLFNDEDKIEYLKEHLYRIVSYFTSVIRKSNVLQNNYISFIGRKYINLEKKRILANIIVIK